MAVNVALETPASTVAEAGTPTIVLFDKRATIEPADGAGCDKVIVHVALAPEATVAGEHVRLDTAVAVTVSDSVAVVAFSKAVSVAD